MAKIKRKTNKFCECGKELSKKKYTKCHSCNMKCRWSDTQYKKKVSATISKTKKDILKNELAKQEFAAKMSVVGKIPWLDEEFRTRKSLELKERWLDNSYREKMIQISRQNFINFWTKPKYEELRKQKALKNSERLKNLWQNESYRNEMLEILSNAFQDGRSKLEKEHEQCFFDYGFSNSEIVGNYILDYCNKYRKICIEIYGDFWHCNPDKWKEDDLNPITLKTAKQTWEKDAEKIAFLQSKGYKVYVLWESDIRKKNFSMEKFLTENLNLTTNVLEHFRGMKKEEILTNLAFSKKNLSVLFENWSNDYNFSTGVRNSNAFNLEKVFFMSKNKKWDKRGAVGSHHYVDLTYLPTIEDVKKLKEKYTFVGVDCVPGSVPMESFVWPKNTLMCFGEEGTGLSKETMALCDKIVHITQFGSIRSLNVGTASGIAMYDYTNKFSKANT